MNFILVWIFVLFAARQLECVHGSRENGRSVLRHINDHRALHRCPPLQLDPELSIDCENYAKHLVTTKNFSHSDPTNQNYTENLCRFKIASKEPLKRCVMHWYSGSRFDLLDSKASEFTTMIWRSSRHMGYGDAPLSSSEAIMVARFTPPGNVPGLYTDNVPPKRKRKKEKEDKKKKKKKEKEKSSCAIRNAYLASVKLFTVLICQLLISPFINVIP